MDDNYTVYRHTSPSGKVYIGITSMNPEKRWGKNGYGYRRQKYFNFEFSTAAARYYGKGTATANHIAECCRGKRNKCMNYKWIYNND